MALCSRNDHCAVCGQMKPVVDSIRKYVEVSATLGRFSGTILVAARGEIIVSDGFEMADREAGITNMPETRFRIGSLSKPFTAMAILQLIGRKKLTTGQLLAEFIPEFPNGRKITLQHLLDHTSGIPDIINTGEYLSGKTRRHSIQDLIGICAGMSLEFEPGSASNYTNSGYILLAHIIETVSGCRYHEFIRSNILEPLGMTATTSGDEHCRLTNCATGYSIDGSDLIHAEERDLSTVTGCGSFQSTTGDLYLWDQALYTDRLIDRRVVNEVVSASKPGFAAGWQVSTMFQRHVLWHGGGIEGFASGFYRFLDEHACVIILSNFEHAWESVISRTVAAILFGQPWDMPEERQPSDVGAQDRSGYAGAYRFSADFIVSVTCRNGRLLFQATRQPRFELFPAGRDEFFMKASPAELTFVRDRTGAVTHMILHQNGQHLMGQKQSDMPISNGMQGSSFIPVLAQDPQEEARLFDDEDSRVLESSSEKWPLRGSDEGA